MLPKISVLIPTLNAQKILKSCLDSIFSQDYPKDKVEIIIADGGSTDDTLAIANEYNSVIVNNALKTAESGKVCALRHSTGEYVALIDSDNILPTKNWFKEMITPLLENPEYVGSEPWSYTYRSQDGFISRYCAMLGMNDPLVHFLKNYDRKNMLTGKWTEVLHEEQDLGGFLLCTFDKRSFPTIGANGTVFRSKFLKSRVNGDYLFDIDILAREIQEVGYVKFIKVKNGIVHTYCESDITKFARKQRRRVNDYLYHKEIGDRSYKWEKKGIIGENMLGQMKFIIYCITVFPLIFQSILGFYRSKDIAWFFHIIACEITLWEYSTGVFRSLIKKQESDRSNWSQ